MEGIIRFTWKMAAKFGMGMVVDRYVTEFESKLDCC